MTIGVVDYGAGNLRNVQAALTGLGVPWKGVARPEDLPGLDGLILPGVGRFGAAARRLAESGLAGPIREEGLAGRPLLGICLGMQLLFEGSEEDADPGLGLLPGRVGRLPAPRLPHIGWAVVRPLVPEAAGGLFRGLPAAFHAYFAHSYAVPADHPAAAALTSCPPVFTSAVTGEGAGRRAVLGVQFHPEKSGADGRAILANFAALVRDGGRAPSPESRGARTGAVAGSLASDVRAKRVIPCLDVKGGRVVKGVRFRDLRDAGDPVERAAAYDRDGADEVCLLDISASQEERRPLLDLVRRVADVLSVPFSVGGGIRSVEEMRALLLAGADRASIGTAAVAEPDLVARAARAFGSQFVIVSIDALRRPDGGAEVTTHGGTRRTGRDAVAWARDLERLGAGEILLNAMGADGTRGGYDLDLTRAVARAVRIPVIASGGAGRPADLARVLLEGEADAALAASMFHDGSVSIRQTKEALRRAGVAVR
jgi:cyclase